ncbi:MAG: type II secretion system protein N [Gammaproteobacteria bacterium]|nr:type II secretion system protein N [Gammaproteobacteria bacterium]
MKNISLLFEDKLAPLLNTEKGRHLAIATLLLASLILLLTLIEVLMTWHADYVISEHKPPFTNTEDASEMMQEMIARIPSQHLFGQSADDDFLPITSLQLHLTGIIQVPESNLSRAIISEGGQSGKIFNVGDELTSGIKIYAINPDSVVLEHAGHLEKLPLSRSKLLFQEMPKPLW